MKIHVTLRRGADKDAINEVVAVGKLTNVNAERAKRFGVLTAEAPESTVAAIRALAQVEAVEADDIKRALG